MWCCQPKFKKKTVVSEVNQSLDQPRAQTMIAINRTDPLVESTSNYPKNQISQQSKNQKQSSILRDQILLQPELQYPPLINNELQMTVKQKFALDSENGVSKTEFVYNMNYKSMLDHCFLANNINSKRYQWQNIIEIRQQRKVEGDNKLIEFKVNNETVVKQLIKDVKQTFNKMDVYFQQSPKIAGQICQSLLNQQPKKDQIKESQAVQKQLRKKVQQQHDPLSIILLGLKNTFSTREDNKEGLIFNKNSSVKTQLSAKIISTQFMQDQVKFQQKIQQKENAKWTYDDIQKSEQKLTQFKQWYIEKIAKQYGIDKETISIHRIIKGSIKVQWSTTTPKNVINVNKATRRLKIHRYFEYFRLSSEDFCIQGNIEFGSKGNVQQRGGWPYFQPVNCKRYGLNVSRKYDNGNDRWLEMSGKDGQWVVAFHGVRAPYNRVGNGMSVMESIVSGLSNGTMLRAGERQAYSNGKSVNLPNQQVGNGIYCSPHVQSTFDYCEGVTVGGKTYYLIFQCRVNPQKIKVCTRNDYWVINNPKDIRPYGILLLKAEDKINYPTTSQLYGDDKVFNWDSYKNKIKIHANA